ncbi:MAG: hypothetical protein ACOC0U_00765 [Desulfovibrionales bacterium]
MNLIRSLLVTFMAVLALAGSATAADKLTLAYVANTFGEYKPCPS